MNITSEDTHDFSEHCRQFALRHIASRKALHDLDHFPRELWDLMGDAGLLGIGIPREYGGSGGGGPVISAAGEALAFHGDNLGMVLSWMYHLAVAGYLIDGFGNRDQKDLWLRDLASGNKTACFAVSEPDAGPHPKYLKTRAEKTFGGYLLNGEKTFLTNGPIADMFIVLAETARVNKRKLYSAFLVPRETSGLTVTKGIDMPFFKPAPHGGIRLEGCLVPDESLLGGKHAAYIEMVPAFREVEDALMMGPVAGALKKMAVLLAEGINPDKELMMDFGRLRSMTDTASVIAKECSTAVDRPCLRHEKASLLIYFRSLAGDTLDLINKIALKAGFSESLPFTAFRTDLSASAGIGKAAIRSRQEKLGAGFFIS